MNDNQSIRYLEDFKAGSTLHCGSHTFTEEEIIRFAKEFDPQVFHLDPDAAAQSSFGGIVASGWHSVSVMMRLMVDTYIRDSSSMGSPGVDEVRWLKPIRPGDTVTVKCHVKDVIASKSKPDRGIIHIHVETINQSGEVVMTVRGMGMYKRRPQ